MEPTLEIRKLNSIEDGIALLREVEFYGRHSHDAQDRINKDSWKKFIEKWVCDHGDWSITEHEKVTVIATMDRGISHEWVRHRLGAYTQESTRFVNYTRPGHEAGFIEPPLSNGLSHAVWATAMEHAETAYKALITLGERPEIARSVFPTGLKTRVVTTYNLRNWRHFFLMRTCREAHPQIKQLTIPLLNAFKEYIPYLYADIEPETSQAENARKSR